MVNEVKLQPGWLEKQIKETREFIKNTTLERAFEIFRAYSADEEPKLESDNDLIKYLIATKPFQIWEHREDYDRFFEGFELKENAIKLGEEYSLKPQVYGLLSLRGLNGTHTLGIFENGKFEPKEEANVWVDTRPSWDEYFLAMCTLISQRSLDKHTKCGALAINEEKAILSTGYNSPPRGYPDVLADLERPGKYIIFEHAERNMVANAARIGVSLSNSTVYVTGPPCNDCYRIMWNAGVKKIIHANNLAKMSENEVHIKDIADSLNCYNKPLLVHIDYCPSTLFTKTIDYLNTKKTTQVNTTAPK